MLDPLASPDLVAEMKDLRDRIRLLERAPRYTPQVVTFVPLGAVRDFGYTSLNVTAFTDLFRADVPLTGSILDYDLQMTDLYGAGITSMEWQINVTPENTLDTYVVASGSGTGSPQFQGRVDLTEHLPVERLRRVLRIDIEARRIGGAGDVGIRQVRPMFLRPF